MIGTPRDKINGEVFLKVAKGNQQVRLELDQSTARILGVALKAGTRFRRTTLVGSRARHAAATRAPQWGGRFHKVWILFWKAL